MIGKVQLADLLCSVCGKTRLRVALAPWGDKVIVCGSCKMMTPFVAADTVALTAIEYQARQDAAGSAPYMAAPPQVLPDGTTDHDAGIGPASDGIVIGKEELDEARRGRAGKGKGRA